MLTPEQRKTYWQQYLLVANDYKEAKSLDDNTPEKERDRYIAFGKFLGVKKLGWMLGIDISDTIRVDNNLKLFS